MTSTILVAGASGYLGRYAVAEFARRGYRVKALVRSKAALDSPGPNMEPAISELIDDVVIADASKPETLENSCKGVDFVFSCMGLTKPQEGITNEMVDHLGNRALLNDAIRHGVRKFIYVSVFSAEKMPDIAVVQAHEAFVTDLKASTMPHTVIRPTGFFSDMGMFFSMVRSGHMFMLGEGTNRVNPIHGADLAAICADGITSDKQEICAGGPDIFTFRETVALAFKALDKEPWITPIPMWIGEAALFITGLFSQNLAAMVSFAVAVSRIDTVAPATGTHHLAAFYEELAKQTR